MKKIFVAFLGVILLISACGSSKNDGNETNNVIIPISVDGDYQSKDGKVKIQLKTSAEGIAVTIYNNNGDLGNQLGVVREITQDDKEKKLSNDAKYFDLCYEGKDLGIYVLKKGIENKRFDKEADIVALMSIIPIEMYKVK